MSTGGADVVRRLFAAYLAQDEAAARELVGDGFRFTSPQDDHIDRAAYFERCFPTADRVARQDLLQLVEAEPGLVLVRYEYELRTGGTFRNMEAITVRDGRVVEVQVYFGGPPQP
ncbi:nuclear transport factor 2 family protein [Kocuria nitroreducens]|uniref:nuclear transport factor 2 family protein n=1 Tax=Kocuria nitroreducens TaxID=3058914 RepID=UPI0036DC0D48